MANDTGPTIKIPVDPGGLNTLMSAKKTAQEATREVKSLQRELEKAAKQGKELDKGIQSQLMGARGRAASAEGAVASFKERAKANFAAAQAASRGGSITRGGSHMMREVRKGASAFYHGGFSGLAQDVGMDMLRGAGPIAGYAMAGLVGVKMAQDFKEKQAQKQLDAQDLQRMAAQGKISGLFAQLANKDIQQPWAIWRDSAKTIFDATKGAAAGLKTQDTSPYAVRKSMRKTDIGMSADARRSSLGFLADLANPLKGGIGGEILKHGMMQNGAALQSNKRMQENEAAADLQKFILEEREKRMDINRKRGTGFTDDDQEASMQAAILRVQQKYNMGPEWAAQFGDELRRMKRDADESSYDSYGKRIVPQSYAPKSRRWRSKKRGYMTPQSEGIFGQDGDAAGGGGGVMGRMVGGAPNINFGFFNAHIFGQNGDRENQLQGGAPNINFGFFNSQIQGSGFERGSVPGGFNFFNNPTLNAPEIDHGMKDLQETKFGDTRGRLINQNEMNNMQQEPLKEPLAAPRISVEQWKFGTGRGMPKTTDTGVA